MLNKNDDIKRLQERVNSENARLDQLKEGQESEAEIKRKQQLLKNLEEELTRKKKDSKELVWVVVFCFRGALRIDVYASKPVVFSDCKAKIAGWANTKLGAYSFV